GDGVERRGPVLGGDLLVALAADEDDLVTGSHVAVGAAVDHELVHRHRAGDRVAAAADQHFTADERQAPSDAVGVAGGHGGDDRVVVEAIPQAIGDPVAGRHL